MTAPEIIPIMIGTSGHVDHGKTSLVKLLTGCDTDRLREEKARGMTIDLGFAPCKFPGNRLAGIVDVPGHEDFIRNMVAGAASIDILLLVVAADDGVMPQTREHLQIIRLLRLPRIMAVITKTDIVDPEMTELVCDDVQELLREAGFPGSPVVPLSNKTFDGIDDVRKALYAIMDSVEVKQDEGAFRMNIERVFSVKGYGTVVTGIPVSGKLAVGEKAEVVNTAHPCTVRAVQTYKQESAAATAGACAAINLRDLDEDAVSRGLTLGAPGCYRATASLLATVRNVSDTYLLKNGGKARFHSGTGVTQVSAKFIGGESLKPGEETFVHLKLSEPLTLAAGDRFVLRSLSPVTTFAGGSVLSPDDYLVKRKSPGLLARLERARGFVRAGDYPACALLAGKNALLAAGEMKLACNREEPCLRQTIDRLVADNLLTPLANDGWLVVERLPEISATVTALLARYHKSNQYAWGMDPALLCKQFGIGEPGFKRLAKVLCDDGEFKLQHGRIALRDFAPGLSAAQIELREHILQLATEGGINAPASGNILKELAVSKTDLKLVTRLLTEERLIVPIGPNLLLRETVQRCREIFLELCEKNGSVGLKEFRDACGGGRNLAVALLEFFDSAGFSRRRDDVRTVANAEIVF